MQILEEATEIAALVWRTDQTQRSGLAVDVSYLVLSLPVLEIIVTAATAHVEITTGADEHIAGGDDIDQGWLSRVLPHDPDCEGDIVAGAAVRDGEEAVETEEQLGAAIVKGWTAIGVGQRGQDQGDSNALYTSDLGWRAWKRARALSTSAKTRSPAA